MGLDEAEKKANITCAHLIRMLRNMGYEVDVSKFPSGCAVDYYDPVVDFKIRRLLLEKGEKEENAALRSKWSTKETITVLPDKPPGEDKWHIRVSGGVVVPIVPRESPEEFELCEVKPNPQIVENLKITEVHEHSDLGHAATHIHFEGSFDPEKRETVAKIISQIKEILSQAKKCENLI